MEWAFLYLLLLGLFSGIISAGIDYTIEFFQYCKASLTVYPPRLLARLIHPARSSRAVFDGMIDIDHRAFTALAGGDLFFGWFLWTVFLMGFALLIVAFTVNFEPHAAGTRDTQTDNQTNSRMPNEACHHSQSPNLTRD